MKINMEMIFLAIMGFSLMAESSSVSVKVPSLYDNGPKDVSAINLDPNEITIIMLLESVMDISSSAILAGGCQSFEDSYSIEISADGNINSAETNFAKISSPKSEDPLVLNSIIEAPIDFFGQNFTISQTKKNKLKDTLISDYSATLTVNHGLTLLSMHSKSNIQGQNHSVIPYQNLVNKNVYIETPQDNSSIYINGWGVRSLSSVGYPANLDWIRFKALRTGGQLIRLVLQADRLVGASACRILIDSAVESDKTNKESKKHLVFKGNMVVSKPLRYEEEPAVFAF